MQPKTLKFRAVGMALVQDYEAMEGGVRKYVGRKAVPLDDGAGRLSWPETEEPAEVPYRPDYVAACRAGDLEAADEDTAKACGVLFPRELAEGEKLEDASSGDLAVDTSVTAEQVQAAMDSVESAAVDADSYGALPNEASRSNRKTKGS